MPFEVGDRVIDRDAGQQNDAIVVTVPDGATIGEWHVPGRETVAADNPEYPVDEQVVIVIFESRLEEVRPWYIGRWPLNLAELYQQDIKYYGFPESRLQRVGSLRDEYPPREVPLTRLQPSPYHARSFSAEKNARFIEAIRERGEAEKPIYVRPLNQQRHAPRYEIVNGHKRAWASHVAGVETIPCYCLDLDDEQAAAAWAHWHLGDYTDDEHGIAVERLEERFGTDARHILPPGVSVPRSAEVARA